MNPDIIDSINSLTEKLTSIDKNDLDPELVSSLSLLHSAIFNTVSGEKTTSKAETNRLNCPLDQLLGGYIPNFTTRILHGFINNKVNTVNDLKEKYSTTTSPKRLLGSDFFNLKIKNFGLKSYNILFEKLLESGFIDNEGIWQI